MCVIIMKVHFIHWPTDQNGATNEFSCKVAILRKMNVSKTFIKDIYS